MTHTQTLQRRRLQDNIVKAYKAFQANTDKSKHDKLAKQWQDAIKREEQFSNRYY